MAMSFFDDESQRPEEGTLRAALGGSSALWEEIRAFTTSHWPPIVEEWAFSSKKAGWSVRLRRRERILLYLIPQHGQFLVGFVLGDRAVEAARQAELPEAVLEQINSARRYAEGTGFRLTVRTPEDLQAVQRLATIKMAGVH